MKTIFCKYAWEKQHDETIQVFYDIEDWEAKEINSIGDYGYRINTDRTYKFITDKGIYFVEQGKAELAHLFNPNDEFKRKLKIYFETN